MIKRKTKKVYKVQKGGAKGRGRRKVAKFLGNLNRGLKKTKAISKVASALNAAGVPYAGSVGTIASQLGYGKRSKRSVKYQMGSGAKRDKYGSQYLIPGSTTQRNMQTRF